LANLARSASLEHMNRGRTMQINILDAKNRLSQLIKYAQSGEAVVIANRGQPVARLVAEHVTTAPGLGTDFLRWLDEHPLPAHMKRDHDEIEADIAAERAAWESTSTVAC
jgi:prevent-host-death family protein